MPNFQFSLTAILLVAVTASAAAQDMKKVEAGEAVYNNYCETCHGSKLVSVGLSSFDLRKLRDGDRERFERSVMDGKNTMPPWRGVLDAEQIDALWAYIRYTAGERKN
jgi:mono/diheme cytochrome c family protein